MAQQTAVENQHRHDNGSRTQGHDSSPTLEDTLNRVREYAQENPEKFALYCLGTGFILGWKLKPW